MTCEEIYIKHITNGIRGLKLNTKSIKELNLSKWFQKLKSLNPMMYDELMVKYQKGIKEFENKNKKIR
jgi:hypothetical protein